MPNQLKLLDDHDLASLPLNKISGRTFESNGKKFVDFCGTNYLSFDHDKHLHDTGVAWAAKWGTMCGWSRLETDPVIYPELEERVRNMVGGRSVLLSHTITLTCMSVIPAIAKKGTIFADRKLHTVVWEACRLARDHGASIVRFDHQNVEQLEKQLQAHTDPGPKLIAVDGVYSLSTEPAPIKELQALCAKYDAWLFVDDAHGFGILGENPSKKNTYGVGGSGVVKHFGGNNERTFYCASFGKAFCTHTAFLSIPNQYHENILAQATSHIYSAPVSPYTAGTVVAAMDRNEEVGEARRARIRELVTTLRKGFESLDFEVENYLSQPVIFLPAGNLENLVTVASHLKKSGVLTGLRAFPVVPENMCGVRLALTALHEQEHVDLALNTFSDPTIREIVRSARSTISKKTA